MRKKEVCQYSVNNTTGVEVKLPGSCLALDVAGDGIVILSISDKLDGVYHSFLSKTYHYSEKTEGSQPFFLKADGSGTATVLFISEL
jgi:hypothetical protein